jgi:thiamine biosynthesis lipoprotein
MTALFGILAITCTANPDLAALQRFEFAEVHMGTRFSIVLYAADEATATRAARAAFARVAVLDGIMSDYRATSELLQLCQKSGGEPVKVSDDLYQVLEKAQEVARISDGAFDVTIGPIVKLWRLSRRTQILPDQQKLAEAMARVGFSHIKLDPQMRTVQLQRPGMSLDLGGIAKGYAADQVLLVLRQHGITSALVAAGGDIAVLGAPPSQRGWKVGIQPLGGGKQPPSRFLFLKDAAVSTSGDLQQFVVIDGKRYSHIVDPRTGLGLVGRVSVSVVAPNGTLSDPLATAVCVLGRDKGLALIDKLDGTAALFVRGTDQGEEVVESRRFAMYLDQGKR